MKATFLTAALALSASAVWWAAAGPSIAQEGQAEQAEAEFQPQEGVEVLTRGPVHEAFAEPVTFEAKETLVIEKQPPEPIDEMPPDQKPEGDNVIWIPGYWAWDDEREDYLWISGVWRAAPPDQEWVPGYWSTTEGGHYWTPGFWASAQLQEVSYLPEPPASVEEGPSSPAPSEDHQWVPGVWRYQETRYVWRPGYWIATQPDWVWIPAHYTWTPGGYVFVDGYWDYPIARRGVLFAPVYFSQPVYVRPAYTYSPRIVINTTILSVHLFARPNYNHFYFGDYYGTQYATNYGIRPWFYFRTGRSAYDPVFSYFARREARRDRDWVRSWEQRYDYFAQHEHARPPRTYRDYRDRSRRGDVNIQNTDVNITNVTNITLAATLNDVASGRVTRGGRDGDRDEDRRPIRFERVEQDRRERIHENARELKQFARHRSEVEQVATTTDRRRGDRPDGQRQDVDRRKGGDRKGGDVAARDNQRSNRRSLSLADRPRANQVTDRASTTPGEAPPPRPDAAGGREGTAETGRTARTRDGEGRGGNAAGRTAQDRGAQGRGGRDAARGRGDDADVATQPGGRTDAATPGGETGVAPDTGRREPGRRSGRGAAARDTATGDAATGDTTAPGAAAGGRDPATARDRTRGDARTGGTRGDARPGRGDATLPGRGDATTLPGTNDPATLPGRSNPQTLPGVNPGEGRPGDRSATTRPQLPGGRDAASGRTPRGRGAGAADATETPVPTLPGAGAEAGARGRDARERAPRGSAGERAPARTGAGNRERGNNRPRTPAASTNDQTGVLQDRLNAEGGPSSFGEINRGSTAAGGRGSATTRVNRQPLDPGGLRTSVEDARTQRNSDVRGTDDFENRRNYGTDRENRVARPGRDDRAGARGATEAGGRRSADVESGRAALPAIRQPRDAGAPNASLDDRRTRRPSDVRREAAGLNEDRRATDRNSQVARPGRDSRGPGGSAEAPENNRSRLDLPDRGRSTERAAERSRREGASSARGNRGGSDNDRRGDRQRERERD